MGLRGLALCRYGTGELGLNGLTRAIQLDVLLEVQLMPTYV